MLARVSLRLLEDDGGFLARLNSIEVIDHVTEILWGLRKIKLKYSVYANF